MRISTRSYYGLRALTYLAKRKGVLAVRTIAQEEDLPYDYLEKIFQRLKAAGLVKSIKGVEGGYLLSRPAKKISAGQIFEILEGQMVSAPCLGFGRLSCSRVSGCSSRDLWQRLETTINQALGKITLADLAQEAKISYLVREAKISYLTK